jgi:hypothetical protein
MRQALINPVAHTVNDAPDFSRRIRLHRIGFDFVDAADSAPQQPGH